MTKRLFISISLTEESKDLLSKYRFDNEDIRWVESDNLHLTVFFLGDVSEEKLYELREVLREKLLVVKPFILKFDSMVFAPSDERVRMIWARFKGNDSYKFLVNEVAFSVKEFVSKRKEHKELIPHVTIARINNPEIGKILTLPSLNLQDVFVEECFLMESQLGVDGSHYTVIEQFSFLKE